MTVRRNTGHVVRQSHVVIHLKKGRDGPSTLACVRDDGSRTWGKEHPFLPLHDLTHCAVESVLDLDQAFFGLIAAGWDIDDFAKPGASAKMPHQAFLAEHVVGLLDRERALPQPMTAAEFSETVGASLSPLDRSRFQPITDAQLATIRGLRSTLEARWHGLPPGATLEIEFPVRVAA
jgi:hypothetical protein